MGTPRSPLSEAEKSALIQQIIDGGASAEEACARHGLSRHQLTDWIRQFRRGIHHALDRELERMLSLQGLELGELSRAEFSGSLEQLGVGELLQTVEAGRKDLHITVTHDGERSEIWCRDGEVVDARSGSLDGEAAFYRILTLTQGEIVAALGPHERPRRIDVSTPRLLLKAASSNGLRARLMQRIGDPRQILVADPRARRRRIELAGDELGVLGLCDGARSVEEVLFASGLADARALDIIARFRDERVLTPSKPPGAGARASLPASSNLTMSYGPLSRSLRAEVARLPRSLLAAGAVLCSALGALSVMAFSQRTASVTPARLGTSSPAAPPAALPPSAPPSGRASPGAPDPALTAPAAQSSAPAPRAVGAVLAAAPGTRSSRCPAGMTWLAGGRFTMGTDSSAAALSLARPAHRVTLRGFCLGASEVTVDEYASCVDAGDCTPAHHEAHFAVETNEGGDGGSLALHGALCNAGKRNRDRHPINCVSQAQAARYCGAHAGRLPSEAEWEYAARGATDRMYPWGDAQPGREHANACGQECARWHAKNGLGRRPLAVMYAADDGYAGTAPVGSFPRGTSPDGIADLIGNVFEWTAGGLYEYGVDDASDPRGPRDMESFVIRGGNFNSTLSEFANPALRFAMHGESYSHGVGFRCAADGPAE